MKNLKERVYHFIFWVFVTLYLLLADTSDQDRIFRMFSAVGITCSYLFIYYSHLLFILPRFYEKRLFLICSVGIDFLIYACLDFLIHTVFREADTEIRKFPLLPEYAPILDELLVFLLISALAFGTYRNKKGIARIKIKRQKEKLLLMNELGFIKNQFNSHVTFNFLNYCYSKVHRDSTEISEAIEVFSKMLRYSMSCRLGERVQLSKEIEYIEDFIRLQKLLQEELKIVFFKDGTEQVYILPRILINFIEHVFKQGNLNSSKLPVFIELHSCGNLVALTIESEKRIKAASRIDQKTLSDHFGLLYKNSYVLETEETYASYKFRLKLMI